MTKSLPTESKLQNAWNELREIHETYGVRANDDIDFAVEQGEMYFV